jgi:hypothetical protein
MNSRLNQTALVAFLGFSFFTANASAQESNVSFGIDYSLSTVENNAAIWAQTAVNAVGGAATVTQDTRVSTGRIFLGYRITEKIGIEAGYFRNARINSNLTGITGGALPYTGTIGVDVDGFDLAATLFPFAEKKEDGGFFVKGGMHSSEVNSFTSYAGAGVVDQTFTTRTSGTGALFGAGYLQNYEKFFYRAGFFRYSSIGGNSNIWANLYSIGIGARF